MLSNAMDLAQFADDLERAHPARAAARRFLFVNRFFHPDISATSQMLTDLATSLAGAGYGVGVIASRLRYEGGAAGLAPHERYSGIEVRRVASTNFGRAGLIGRSLDYVTFASAARRSIGELADAGTVVIAKTDPPMLGTFLANAVSSKGAECVHWMQDFFPEVAEEAGVPLWILGGGARLRRLRDEALAGAAAIVAVGEKMAERIRATGAARGPVHTIPNWADGRVVKPLAHERNAFRRALGLEGKFVVGYAGNLGRVHDFETLVEAARVLKSDARIRFLFVGGGMHHERMRDAVRRHSLENVLFAPYQSRDRLAEALGAADVHLCSLLPRFEGLVVPSKIYGIMAAGRPCIFVGDADGEIARLARRGDFGSVVQPGDAERLARDIGSLAADASEAQRLGHNARVLFEREFDLPVAVAKWRRVLESLPSSRGKPNPPH
jgi:glycosyltransferase involved in cell wall biosynthesis